MTTQRPPLAIGETVVYEGHEYYVAHPGSPGARNAELRGARNPNVILFVDPAEFDVPELSERR